MTNLEHYFENLLFQGKDICNDINKDSLSDTEQKTIEACYSYILYVLFDGDKEALQHWVKSILWFENDLGFDLTKLQNTNHIYTYDYENNFKKYEIVGINLAEKKIYFWDSFCPMSLDLADYKKYWWLKEDRSE